jgi:hypothetical protein
MPHASCYHCGLPIPDDVDLSVTVAGEPRALCCFGCQAVAQSIVDNGLDDYYRSPRCHARIAARGDAGDSRSAGLVRSRRVSEEFRQGVE